MYALRLRCRADEKDWLTTQLWERGTEGITEQELPDTSWMLEAFFDSKFDARGYAVFTPVWAEHAERDWAEAWKEAWEPISVGTRFYLVPDWRDDPAPDGRLRLTVHAGLASGSGYQAPTQLALEALEGSLHSHETFFDWGTGSGILASAARLLGATRIFACDVDHEAVRQARQNLRHDGVEAPLFTGTGRSLRPDCVDVLAANMNAAAILEWHTDIARVVKPGGRIILSGFKQRRARAIEAAFFPLGFQRTAMLARDDWRCLVLS